MITDLLLLRKSKKTTGSFEPVVFLVWVTGVSLRFSSASGGVLRLHHPQDAAQYLLSRFLCRHQIPLEFNAFYTA